MAEPCGQARAGTGCSGHRAPGTDETGPAGSRGRSARDDSGASGQEETAAADDQNRASFLRSHCLTKTRGQLQQQEMIPGQTNLGEIITACPSPVFVMSPERKILLYNPAFVSTVLDEMKNRAGGRPVSPRLTFSQPFKKIVQYLVANPNKVVSVQVGFTSEDISLQRNARFALLNRGLGEGSSVVVFVEDNRW